MIKKITTSVFAAVITLKCTNCFVKLCFNIGREMKKFTEGVTFLMKRINPDVVSEIP